MSISDQDIAQVEQFIADPGKTLDGPHPDWQQSPRLNEYQAVWPIIEGDGRTRAHLRFRVAVTSRQYPSISVIFRNECITRLDRVPASECEPNPPMAQGLGLPPLVCGTHIHTFADNKPWILLNGRWELPVRRPVEDTMDKLPHMFHWFASQLAITLDQDQYRFDVPPKSLLEGA